VLDRAVCRNVSREREGVLRERLKLRIYTTDARVAFACTKYDKGSVWVGSSPLNLALTAGGKVVASERRRGRMFVGHIRYPWLKAAGSTSRTGMFTQERLMFGVAGEDHEHMKLSLILPKSVSAANFAAEVARRAAAYRLLIQPDVDDHTREKLEALTHAKPRIAPPNEQRFHQMPCPFVVCERAARLRPNCPGSSWPAGPQPVQHVSSSRQTGPTGDGPTGAPADPGDTTPRQGPETDVEVRCPSCGGSAFERTPLGAYRCVAEDKIFGANELARVPVSKDVDPRTRTGGEAGAIEEALVEGGLRCPSCGRSK
jgi:hypothetical protein